MNAPVTGQTESAYEAARKDRIRNLGAAVSQKLGEIAALYRDQVFVTLIVRAPAYPDNRRDTVMTDDPNVEAAITALRALYSDPDAERYPA